jgi:chromosome segregation ATPase
MPSLFLVLASVLYMRQASKQLLTVRSTHGPVVQVLCCKSHPYANSNMQPEHLLSQVKDQLAASHVQQQQQQVHLTTLVAQLEGELVKWQQACKGLQSDLSATKIALQQMKEQRDAARKEQGELREALQGILHQGVQHQEAEAMDAGMQIDIDNDASSEANELEHPPVADPQPQHLLDQNAAQQVGQAAAPLANQHDALVAHMARATEACSAQLTNLTIITAF